MSKCLAYCDSVIWHLAIVFHDFNVIFYMNLFESICLLKTEFMSERVDKCEVDL